MLHVIIKLDICKSIQETLLGIDIQYNLCCFHVFTVTTYLRGCEETLAELTSNMKNIKTEINAIVMDKTKQKRELAGLTKKVEKLRQTNVVTKRKLEELRTMDDSESVNVQSLVCIFICYCLSRFIFTAYYSQESETAELNRTVQRLTAQHEEIDQQMESIKETIKGREERLVELAQVMKGFEDKIAPLEV